MKPNDTTLTRLDLIRAIGAFDFDPCGVHGHPTAAEVIVWPDDGLAAEWHGAVWCNPPYSDPGPWMRKLAAHGNGVALVLASTDTAWFQEMSETAEHYLFLKGRPEFMRLDQSPVKLMRASVLVGWGDAAGWLRGCPLPGVHMNRKPASVAAKKPYSETAFHSTEKAPSMRRLSGNPMCGADGLARFVSNWRHAAFNPEVSHTTSPRY